MECLSFIFLLLTEQIIYALLLHPFSQFQKTAFILFQYHEN